MFFILDPSQILALRGAILEFRIRLSSYDFLDELSMPQLADACFFLCRSFFILGLALEIRPSRIYTSRDMVVIIKESAKLSILSPLLFYFSGHIASLLVSLGSNLGPIGRSLFDKSTFF